jgi:dienelactone hydrolase
MAAECETLCRMARRHGSVILITFVTLACAQALDPVVRTQQFIALLAQSDFASAQAMLDAETAALVPAAKLQQVWAAVGQQAGAYKENGTVRAESSGKPVRVVAECRFEKLTLDVHLTVDDAGRIGGLNFAQHVDYTAPDYVKIGAFQEEEVVVGSGPWAVHGTLTRPNGPGPFAGLVLVHGSGPNDMDSTLGPNKMFRDIAWGAASKGVAVLRYNKRTNEHGAQFARLTNPTANQETVEDALAAAALLRTARGIDAKKIFVLGHSLGGTLIPRIGKADAAIAGLIILGGTTHSLLDVLVPQTELNFTLHGPMSDAQTKLLESLRQQVARANDPKLTADTPSSEMPLGIPPSYWLDLRGYHPEQVARGLQQPLLILQGERDYQVTMDDYDTWKRGLAGRSNVEFRVYPKLNHMFMPGEGVSSDEEYLKPGHVQSQVVEDIANWVQRR